jgi:HD-GYP domain-containing protein (c-di-GMP phosphodiesterase class II)
MLNELTISGDISLSLFRSRFHIGEEKLRYRRDAAIVVYNMVEFFSKRNIGGVNFLNSSRDALPENIIKFTRLFNNAIRHENPYQWLEQNLREQDCLWVQIFPRQDDDAIFDSESLEDKRIEKARKNYFLAIEAVKEVANKVSQGMVGVRRCRRLAQNIVDVIKEDATLMIGLTTLKGYDDYTYAHSVNVALLATCLGKHIELSDISLEHLTICGLFHDLGKIDVPRKILFKHGALTDGEWELMKAHPVMGVRKILMLNATPSLRSRIILGPFEHHLNPDMTGYPRTLFMGHMSLLGKILRIADVYEALTAERGYRPRSFQPEEALRMMWGSVGKSFDTILLKRFIHMMGVYPIGSVVELSDGSIGLVMDYPDEAERTLPVVLRLVNDEKGGWQRGEMVYLADQINKDGSGRLKIVRGLPLAKIRINPSDFFLHSM